ncbi:MAG: U32 family peptidase [Bacteriovoracaceae bacterium]|jgi:putative protease|nr:U32 family peptidase [Bacteriovoracaceae bacterium]
MDKVVYISTLKELEIAKEYGVKEVILGTQELSRFGKLDAASLAQFIQKAIELKLSPIVEWDIISTETDFAHKVEIFKSYNLDKSIPIRVQDIGTLNYILENTSYSIELNLEGSNHNLTAVKAWERICGKRLKKVILSIELSKEKLKDFCLGLDTQVEILGLGRILLFYTPRNLLSSMLPEDDEKRIKQNYTKNFLEALGESEESPHKGFPLVENMHGTFMFHIKRLNLLKHFEEIKELGVSFVRLDFRFDDENIFRNILSSNYERYPYDSIKGFFNINKSDVLFKKLKNYRVQRKDHSYIGEVLEVAKDSYIAVKVKQSSLDINTNIVCITPEGKEKILTVKSVRDTSLNSTDSIVKGAIAILTYHKGITVKSQIYKK